MAADETGVPEEVPGFLPLADGDVGVRFQEAVLIVLLLLPPPLES